MSEFKSWDELSRNEKMHCEYYDFYKEVHGIRPRWIYAEGGVPAYDEAEMERMLDSLVEESKRVFAEEAAAELRAIAKFENYVAELCKSLGKDRETIVRWLMDGSDSMGDWDYYCFQLGVPYGYFKEFYSKKEVA
jgi:hypothetical protein